MSQPVFRHKRNRQKAASPAQSVLAWVEELTLPTYSPAAPDRNPMFLEKRVYQGSSGKVYPLPFTDRIAEKPVLRKWKAVWLENEFLKVLILPELGGRVHRAIDKTNNYDFIYYQPVIKPALVGLAGPWISGGIEFNWPQHHRPATFLPVEFCIRDEPDGARTVWCSDHDPLARMKGMHGVCLHPGKAYLELRVRACNRTAFVQTFLWWANVATRVHEGYQSFFPPDVVCVADHARRAMSSYPLCDGWYYGVNYGKRATSGIPPEEIPSKFIPPHCRQATGMKRNGKDNRPILLPNYAPNDLSWYANIPTPCSYMCTGSEQDFFGGYDHFREAGLVHVANHHISPGKKQWTWGNHEFGYSWDRNLTDPDEKGEFGPYIELMAGVFTDNQPDFSFLRPNETKTWTQYWYPIRKIGPAQNANLESAVSLRLLPTSRRRMKVRVGIAVTSLVENARVELHFRGEPHRRWTAQLSPARPFLQETAVPGATKETDLRLRVLRGDGTELISYQPQPPRPATVPPSASEPPAPEAIASADELFVTGLHLEQYRHATRCPTLYWREALRRDPLDARCNNALGRWHLRRGEFPQAQSCFRRALERLTARNQNPYDTEPFYNLGLCLRFQAENDASLLEKAYNSFYKAAWSQAWAGPAWFALAELDCRKRHWPGALEHLDLALALDSQNLRARNLKALVLRRLGRDHQAGELLRQTLELDPLDVWTRYQINGELESDLQTCLDVAHDLARAGVYSHAIALLETALRRNVPTVASSPASSGGVSPPGNGWGKSLNTHEPLGWYTLAWLWDKLGKRNVALKCAQKAAALPPDYCFPARLEDIAVLQTSMRLNPRDARAPYYLGNLFYDRRRHREAIRFWEQSAEADPRFPTVWRNLGIACFNVLRKPARAKMAYATAFRNDPADARLLYERDQLWKRLRVAPPKRLAELEKHLELVRQRDDLTIELCALYNLTGRHEQARELLRSRRFQPWEGGEGLALGQHTRTHLALGKAALAKGDTAAAIQLFREALSSPENLGEAKHLLANQSDIHFWLGAALETAGDRRQARAHWRKAATFRGDFQEMSVRSFSEMTFFSAKAWERLGNRRKAIELFRNLLDYALKLEKQPAKIDYFATSLPTMLLFDEDLQARQITHALFLQSQARLGLGQRSAAARLLRQVLRRDPSHALAADLKGELSKKQKVD